MKNAASGASLLPSLITIEPIASAPSALISLLVQAGLIGQGIVRMPARPASQRVSTIISPPDLTAQHVLPMHLNDCHKS